ncbi:MAG: shikimate dehydrogenase [Clostridiales bacterium]|nr:shikimate dehydrogenase [Clostridiales bacterium]
MSEQKKVCCVIGDPVSHSFSPVIHELFAKQSGIGLAYTAFHVLPEGLGDAIKGASALGIKGINVTVPHKTLVMEHLVSVEPDASAIGAVNTLTLVPGGYAGSNTDWIGLKAAIESHGCSLAGKKVAVIGAGGSARAACYMAAKANCKEIVIANRTLEKAESLRNMARECGCSASACLLDQIMDFHPFDVAIQTTTVGFGKNINISPVPPEFFSGLEIAIDIIYSPWETEFLRLAKGKCKTANGFAMLVHQAAASFETWFGESLGSEFLKKAVCELEEKYARREGL